MLAVVYLFLNREKKSVQALVLGLAMLGGIAPAHAMIAPEREVASMAFPQHKATSDVDDIMDDYPEYLKFVLEIGRDVNPKVASQIETRWAKLKKADERLASRFLKGLRFEMVQKMELSGMSSARVTTNSGFMRTWVKKYMGAWLREVDEYQYRAYAQSLAKRD